MWNGVEGTWVERVNLGPVFHLRLPGMGCSCVVGVRGEMGGYSGRWKGWEFKATVQGPHSSHTKGCPQNAPHSLNPLSRHPPPPSQRALGVPPRSHTNTQTDIHTLKMQARKRVKQFTGLILWRVFTHSNRTERQGETEGCVRVGSRIQ